ncbi:MAG: GAF domain-containing sensor histidine kinase [Ardenticatenaceae bacterium]|nr:GAF domain-containing sensor histidine kinase [Anaerolineales bacterium]MCB8979839.1 GAF domain-containing sensor histidine kinase [Ardenticatenaceae bacterium]
MSESKTADLQKILRQQETLRAIIESISSELELRPLLTRIVQHACELLDADRGTIGLVDEERQLVRTEAVFQMPPDELGAEMSSGVGLAGKVLASQKPLILGQYGELDTPLQTDLMQDAVIGLPIFWHDQMIGFFGIGADPPRRFAEQDVELLTQLARHAAIAIENARLFAAEKRRAARQRTLTRIGEIISSTLALDDLLQTAVTAVREHLDFAHAGFLMPDEDDPEMLILVARSGIYANLLPDNYRQSIHEGLIGAAARSCQPVITTDAMNDPRYKRIPGADNVQSMIAIPVVVADQLLGVLNVESDILFDEEDVAVLEIVGGQLGSAITTARLFDQMQRNLAETQLLYETSRRMTNAFDVDDVIEAYLQHVAVRGRYVCTVALYEFNDFGERTAVTVRGVWSPDADLQLIHKRFAYIRDGLDPLLDQGQTVLIGNVHTDPRANEELRRLQSESGRPALAMIPLIVRRQRIGVVILTYPNVYRWQESDLWPYQVTAAQLATAIDTRRQQLLLVQSSQEVAVLHERQRLARELHDSVTQLIFSMTLVAQSIAPAWQRHPAEGETRVNRVLELSQSALAEMRALLFELRSSEPPPLPTETGVTLPGITRLRRDGLTTALARHIESLKLDTLQIGLEAKQYQPQPLEIEIALFRITQEALNNVIKHARAKKVAIGLTMTATAVHLKIQDDGAGFAGLPGKEPNGGGLGLRTMRERAESLNGRLQINSVLGQGTAVEAWLPITNGETK